VEREKRLGRAITETRTADGGGRHGGGGGGEWFGEVVIQRWAHYVAH